VLDATGDGDDDDSSGDDDDSSAGDQDDSAGDRKPAARRTEAEDANEEDEAEYFPESQAISWE
jgi:hypothetical protein